MTQPDIAKLIARLHTCDTPTVCNAIEVAQGGRGFAGFTRRSMVWAGEADARIVGFARTARIAGNAPPTEPPDDIRARRMAYFKSMNDGPRPGRSMLCSSLHYQPPSQSPRSENQNMGCIFGPGRNWSS